MPRDMSSGDVGAPPFCPFFVVEAAVDQRWNRRQSPKMPGLGQKGLILFFEQDSNTHTVINPASVTDPAMPLSPGYLSCLHSSPCQPYLCV